ncbi:MAG: phosphatase PAP2 family protein, partial [Deltaproteobacteria bacterium]|nr:phosphatase PAP2 family protein [Deltaproteobacteria bacterium]
DGGWFLKRKQPWDLMYRFGGVPGLLLGAGALFCAVFGARLKGTACARKMALHFVLALVVGQGLAVGALKSAWKRPRPKEIRHYGGVERFLRVGEVGTSRRHRSFPSSHATIAYYLITPFFVLRRTRRGWAVCFLVVGILYGTLMGVGRLAYGGHFASDIVGSAALTYLTGLAWCWSMRSGWIRPAWRRPDPENPPGSKGTWCRARGLDLRMHCRNRTRGLIWSMAIFRGP